MSVNKQIDSGELRQIAKSVFPTQFEPGSLADRLLKEGHKEGHKKGRKEGREEGKLAGQVQLLQQLLSEPIHDDATLVRLSKESLIGLIEQLQQRLRDRPA